MSRSVRRAGNVLKEYLENKEQEVVDIMMTLFDDEQVLKAIQSIQPKGLYLKNM